MQKYLIAFLLFALPLIIWPFGVSFFETPKIISAEIAIEILFLITLFRLTSLRSFNKTQLFLIVAVFVLSLIHLIFFNTSTTFFGNIFRLQGIFLLWHLLIFSAIASTIKLVIPKAIYLFTGVGILVGLILFGTNQAGRFVSTLGEPNALAATAVFFWPFIFFNFLNKPIRILTFLGLGVVLVLSGSRSGLMAFVIQLVFLLSAKRWDIRKSTLIAVILIILSFGLPFLVGGGWFENRAEVWETAYAAGFKQPVTGSGFGNIEKSLAETAISLSNNLRFQYVDSSHNMLLDWWVQAGIVGVAALITLISFSLKNLIFYSKRLELTLLIGLLTVISFNPASIATLVAFWWILGQGFKPPSR